jgi:hypothetical protein
VLSKWDSWSSLVSNRAVVVRGKYFWARSLWSDRPTRFKLRQQYSSLKVSAAGFRQISLTILSIFNSGIAFEDS